VGEKTWSDEIKSFPTMASIMLLTYSPSPLIFYYLFRVPLCYTCITSPYADQILNDFRFTKLPYGTLSYPALPSGVLFTLGAVHKVRYARGGGGPRRCDSLWQGEKGVKSMWRHTYKKFYPTYETWNLKWCLTFWCNRCILTERGQTKSTPDKTFQTWKDPLIKPPDKTPANNWDRICARGLLSGFFVLSLLKIGGSEMCDLLSGRGPGMCDEVWQGRR